MPVTSTDTNTVPGMFDVKSLYCKGLVALKQKSLEKECMFRFINYFDTRHIVTAGTAVTVGS